MATVSCCPTTYTGYCLPDGTPIGIVMQTGAQIGWINITTGVFTAGPPPNGTTVCGTNTAVTAIEGSASDAFARLRVSSPFSRFDATHQYNSSPLYWSEWVSGGSTAHLPNESSVLLTTNGANGNFSRFQSRRYLRYLPGRGSQIILTGLLGAAEAGVRRRWGYFDNDDGLFFEQDGLAGLYIVRRTSTSGAPVDNRTPRANWNVDKLDGTGPSGVVFDETKMQLFELDFQWLSTGQVRWWFEYNGERWLIHKETFTNVLTVPYMKTANLPVRYEISNTADTGHSSTMKATCQVKIIEGGHDESALIKSVNRGTSGVTVGTTRLPIISIRPKLTLNGLTNRGNIQVVSLNVQASGDFLWELFYVPTLTGASWTSAGANSITEFDTAATAITITGTELIASGYKASGPGEIDTILDLEKTFLSLNPDGTTSDIMSLAVTSLGGNIVARAALVFREEY